MHSMHIVRLPFLTLHSVEGLTVPFLQIREVGSHFVALPSNSIDLNLLLSNLLGRLVHKLFSSPYLLCIYVCIKLLRLKRAEHSLDVNLRHFECLLDAVCGLNDELLLSA